MTNGIVSGGLGLLWRRQSVLWWLFAVNLVMGFLASVPARVQLGFLDHTLAADALYHHFDITRFVEVLMKPEVNASVALSGSLGLALAYFLLALFLTGGVLEVYYTDRHASTGEFFRACGEYFWRLARLMLLFGLALVPLLIINGALSNWTQKLSNESPHEQLGFWTRMAGLLLLLLAAMALRLWFDLAQVHVLAENETAVRRSLARVWRLPRLRRMYAIFVAINLCGFAVIVGLFLLWIREPHARVGLSLLLGELMALAWLATRLWQRAAEVLFYQKARAAGELPSLTMAVEMAAPALETPPAAL